MVPLRILLASGALAGCGGMAPGSEIPVTSPTSAAETRKGVALLTGTPTSVTVVLGDIIEVRLPATIGAGFGWQPAATLPRQLVLLETIDEPRRSDLEGGQQFQRLRFHAVGEGQVTLDLDYRRPWEKAKPPQRTLRHRITIVARRR